MGGAILIVLVVGFIVYLTGGRYESTDDAQVVGARVQVSSTLSGRVVSIAVHEGELVHTGQLLFQLDGRPYQTATAEAQANLAQSRLNVQGLQTTYRQRLADLKAAQDSAAYLAGEAARARAPGGRRHLDRLPGRPGRQPGHPGRAAGRGRRANRSPTPWPRWAAIPTSRSTTIRPSASPPPGWPTPP